MPARMVQVLTAVAVAAGLATATTATAVVPPPTDVPGPVLPGPVVPGPVVPDPVQPGPVRPPLAWEVELKDGWRSPSWKQSTRGVSAAVHLDCGNVVGIRLPRYWVQLVPEDGRMRPAVMPDPVPCGVTHTFTWDEPAGAFHLLLTKVSNDGVVLRGKAAVRTSPRFGPS